jgi:TusA-related sulfurtransferase
MYFGEYLLEKNMINEEQLIDALASQIESLPSFLLLIKDNAILNSGEILKIISKQVEQKTDILNVIRNENILSADKINEVFDLQLKKKKPLGQILVEKDSLSVEKLEIAINDYIKIKSEYKASVPNEEIIKSQSTISEPDTNKEAEVSAAALESLKELGLSDQGEIAELETQVSSSAVESNSAVDISSAALESLKELGVSDESEIKELSSHVAIPSTTTNNNEVAVSSAALESLKELGLSADSEISELESSIEVGDVELSKEKVSDETGPDQDKKSEDSGDLNDAFLEQLLTTFDSHMLSRLKKIVSIIEDTAKADGDIANFFNSLYRDFHVIKGVARLSEAKNLETLIDKWEEVIEKLFSNSNEDNKKWVGNNLADLSEVIEFMWNIRESISSSRTESTFMNSPENQTSFEKLCKVA